MPYPDLSFGQWNDLSEAAARARASQTGTA
jgi:hypothetical protein